MKKIKIVYIITNPIYGGAMKVVLSTVEKLNKEKFIAFIITGGKCISDEDLSSEIKNKGVDLILIPELVRNIRPLKDFIAFIKLYYFIKKLRPDIVHTHTLKAGILARPAAKLAGVPIIIHTPHGSIFKPLYINRITIFCLIIIKRFISRLSNRIITICEDEEDDYLSLRIAEKKKFIRISNGIDLNEFTNIKVQPQEIKKELGIPYSAKVIGNVSRLSKEKGHLFLLKAFQSINNVYPDTVLLLAGEGKLEKTIKQEAVKLGINENLILTGLRKDVPEILSIIDVFAHPSLCDSFPLAIIEAMAAGKPIVATRTGGTAEIIDDNETGILIEPYDAQSLSNAIISLLGNEMRRKELAQKARIKAQHFDINKIVRQLENLYLTELQSKN